jgi:hypothetical protein
MVALGQRSHEGYHEMRVTRTPVLRRLIIRGASVVVPTAAALLAVMAGCGSSVGPPKAGRSAVSGVHINWQNRHFPIHCGKGVKLRVLQAKPLLPEPGQPRIAVLIQCQLEDGTGHAELLTYSTRANHTRLAQELIRQNDALFPSTLLVVRSQRVISLGVFAFSSVNTPRCCPNVRAQLLWRWGAGRFRLANKPPPHATGF